MRFELPNEEAVRGTFVGELNYECGKLFYIVFLTMVVWLPYVPNELRFHQHPMLAVSIRLGFTLVGIIAFALKFTKYFNPKPALLLKIIVVYLYFGAALIAATAGEDAVSYTGGFMFVIMVPMIAPFPLSFKITTAILALAMFFVVGSHTGIDFSRHNVRNSVNDLCASAVAYVIFSYIQNLIKYKAWKQRKKLIDTLKLNEKNLTTIFNLAQKAEASDRAKSNFLANMSHEIRTPLNAIIGIAQIQLQKDDLPVEYAIAQEKIYNSSKTLLGIINDILDMSKIETGKLELIHTEYDLPSLINDTVQLNIVRIGSKLFNFVLDIDEKLPIRLHGDELRIKQILNNLLSNAIKYTEKGQVKLSVSHWLEEGNVILRFVVEDTGQGMKPEDLERLFSEYQRFNIDVNYSIEGTGLGLSIVERLVEMMDGTIGVKSEYGKGSIFTVTIKQKAVECPAIGAEIVKQLCSFTFTSGKQAGKLQITREPMPYGKVLVVDDVESNLYVTEGLLSPYKLKIEKVESGFAAIEKVESGNTYDIIFMDHMMPKMDGIETTQKLRKFGYTGIIVALTANAIAGNDEIFLQNGFDGFISKPIDVQHLNAVLNEHIRDQHPEEAKKYKPETVTQIQTEINPKLLQIFRRGAGKSIATLRGTSESNDIKLFTTTAHAIKSALANIGESKLSQSAFALESAGLNGDKEYISANTEAFIKMLEKLLKSLSLVETAGTESEDITEDTIYLVEQLQIVRTACVDYDDAAAYAALDRLKEKHWRMETTAALEDIRDTLFLHSDFDLAAERSSAIIAVVQTGQQVEDEKNKG